MSRANPLLEMAMMVGLKAEVTPMQGMRTAKEMEETPWSKHK
jgi:hypothetical protein